MDNTTWKEGACGRMALKAHGCTLRVGHFQVGDREGWLASVKLTDGSTWSCDREHPDIQSAQDTAAKLVAAMLPVDPDAMLAELTEHGCTSSIVLDNQVVADLCLSAVRKRVNVVNMPQGPHEAAHAVVLTPVAVGFRPVQEPDERDV